MQLWADGALGLGESESDKRMIQAEPENHSQVNLGIMGSGVALTTELQTLQNLMVEP